MDRYVLIFCLCSIPFITAQPTIEGPTANAIEDTETQEETGPPAPPPSDYVPIDHPAPPVPDIIGEEEEHLYEHPSLLLTSEQIRARFSLVQFPVETHGKTIDEIILENTKDLNASNVREGDIRVSKRKRRSTEDDEDFEYNYDSADPAPEAPQLSDSDIHDLPPIDKVAKDVLARRSSGETIDQVLKKQYGGELEQEERPMASAFLMGQAAARPAMQSDFLYDMDMLLTPEQKEELFDSSSRKKRAAIIRTLWKDAVLPYSFMANAFSEADKTQIYAAMNEWQEKTCVRFEPYTSALARRLGHKNRLQIQNGQGCSSYVGMIRRGPQPVTLASGCRIKSIVLHELGHAIGLHHEQCRPDRDNYVRINERNVYPSMLYNFDKYSTSQIDYRGESYDYRSIMHYGKTAFSSNGQITIQPKDNSVINVIGNAQKLSGSDARVVKAMYGCRANPTPKPTTTRAPTTKCEDKGEHCDYWKKMGQCEANPGYMTRFCTMTCGFCKGIDCKNINKYCPQWAGAGYCRGKYEGYMTRNCPKSCGKCGTAYKDMAQLLGTNMPTDAGVPLANPVFLGIPIPVFAAILVSWLF